MQVAIKIPNSAHHVISDFTDWDRNPLECRDMTHYALELASDAYLEYAFLDSKGKVFADPENQQVAENPWTKEARVLQGPEYAPDAYALLREDDVALSKPERKRFSSDIWQATRRLMIYTPIGFERQVLPVVLVQDGTAYYRVGRLHVVLQQLINEQRIRPAHLVFIEPQDRTHEYLYNSAYQDFIVQEVMPLVEQSVSISGEWLAMGASLGGLASSLLAWQYPKHFSTVIAQSGAFLGSPEHKESYHTERSWLLEQIAQSEKIPLRVYLDVGQIEWLLAVNQKMAATLQTKDYDVTFKTRAAGHNWVNWRNGLAEALQFALGE